MDTLLILYIIHFVIMLYTITSTHYYYLSGEDVIDVNNSEISKIPLDDIDEWGQYVNLE